MSETEPYRGLIRKPSTINLMWAVLENDDSVWAEDELAGLFAAVAAEQLKAEMTETPMCAEHDLPGPCLRCALLCGCGCDNLRDGVSEEVWDAAKAMEPFIRQQEARDRG